MATDVFSLLVKIGVVSDHTKVLGGLISMLGVAETTTQKLIKSLGGVKGALGTIGALVAAREVVTLTGKLLTAGSAVADVQAKLFALGDTKISVGLDTAAAQAAAQNVGGVTTSSALQQLVELRSVTSNEDEARAVLQTYATAARNLAIFNADHGTSHDVSTILPLLKAGESQGAFNNPKTHQIDPDRINSAIKIAEAALEITNGVLTPSVFMRMTNLAGPSAQAMDFNKWVREMLEPAIVLGSGAGRGSMLSAKTLLGGSVTKAEVEALEKLKLIAPSNVLRDHGHFSLKQGKLVGFDTLLHDGLDSWVHKSFLPALQAAHPGKTLDGSDILSALSSFPITMQRLIAFFTTNEPQVIKAGLQLDQRMSTDANAQLMNTSVTANLTALDAAWTDMLQTFGGPLVTPAIAVLHGLTSVGHELSAIGQMPGVGIGADAALLTLGVGSTLKLIAGSARALQGLMAVLGGAEGAAAVTAATTLGGAAGVVGSLASVGAGLTALAAPVAAIFGVLKIGSDAETQENRQRLEDIRKGMGVTPPSHLVPQDGFDEMGRPVKKSSYNAPAGGQAIQLTAIVNLDGRYLSKVVSNHMAQYGSLPQQGTSRVDTSMFSPSPGQQVLS